MYMGGLGSAAGRPGTRISRPDACFARPCSFAGDFQLPDPSTVLCFSSISTFFPNTFRDFPLVPPCFSIVFDEFPRCSSVFLGFPFPYTLPIKT